MTLPILEKGAGKSVMAFVVAGLTAVAAIVAMFVALLVTEPERPHEPFPAQALRTADQPPSFALVNQDGDEVSLEALRGKVVMVTGVFATCHTACPTIIAEAKEAVTALSPEQRDDVAIVAITLDPAGDTQDKRKATAQAHGLEAPTFNYVNGTDAAEVTTVLDAFNFARGEKDPETGVMGHVNMFVLIDRDQKIAYRLTLGSSQHHWLADALRVLVAES